MARAAMIRIGNRDAHHAMVPAKRESNRKGKMKTPKQISKLVEENAYTVPREFYDFNREEARRLQGTLELVFLADLAGMISFEAMCSKAKAEALAKLAWSERHSGGISDVLNLALEIVEALKAR